MRYIYTFLAAIILAACAVSPQVVVVNPEINVAAAGNAQPVSVSVEVVDTRNSKVIGQRGGISSKTSDISTDENMTAALEGKVGGALGQLGYTVVEKGKPAHVSLTVTITNLSYVANYEHDTLQNIETKLEIRIVGKKNDREFTGNYTITNKKDVFLMPSELDNEVIVNKVFTSVLENMLKDQDLHSFIQG